MNEVTGWGFAVRLDGTGEAWRTVDGETEHTELSAEEAREQLGHVFAPWLFDEILPVPMWKRIFNHLAPNRRSRFRLH